MAVLPSNWYLYGPGITRIAVTGFKSLATKADVEIRPLTVLAGANSSGKSSLMQPLLLMKQTFDNERIPPGPFWLSGELAEYTSTDQFLTNSPTEIDAPKQLTVELEAEGNWVELSFEKKSDSTLAVVGTASREAGERKKWELNRDTSSEVLEEILSSVSGRTANEPLSQHTELLPGPDRCLLGVAVRFADDPIIPIFHRPEVLRLRNKVQDILYVSGLRGTYDREFYLHGLPSAGPFPGDFEDYVPSILEAWKNDSTQTGLGYESLNAVREALQLLELASDVQTRKLNESQIEVRVPRTLKGDSKDLVNIADVGLAVEQILSSLVALTLAHPNQLVYIEQPELHLHPRAQWKLARILAQASNRGVRLVIETHSSLLLRGILTEIAENRIANDKVILHWFERDEETGLTTIRPKVPDSAGRVGDWPEDFSDVELKSDNQYLDAVEKKLYTEAE
ncbi:MAG: AAA family ATPase [Terracidiphilus sp.]|jgi:predicted ATPase